jgi:hypothetical protein
MIDQTIDFIDGKDIVLSNESRLRGGLNFQGNVFIIKGVDILECPPVQ